MSIESVPSTMRDARSRSLVDSSHKEFPLRESFYHYARRAFPHGRNVAMKRARFIVRALCRWRLHDVWLKLLEAPQLRPIVERQPLLYAKIQREYVLNGIGAASRLAL